MIAIFKKIFVFARDQQKTLAMGIVWAFINCVFKVFSVMVVAYAVSTLVEGTITAKTALYAFGISFIGVVGSIISNYFGTMDQTVASYTASANGTINIAERLKSMPMGYFNESNLGKITSIATNAPQFLTTNLTKALIYYLQGIFMAIVISLSLFIFDWRLALVAVASIVLYFIMTALMQKVGRSQVTTMTTLQKELIHNTLEYLQGISVVKSYNLVGGANKKIKNIIKKNTVAMYALEKAYVPLISIQNFIFKTASFTMLTLSIMFFIDGSMNLVNAVMINIFAFMIFSDLELGSTFSAMFRLIESSIDDINGITDAPIMGYKDNPAPIENYDITLSHADFSYDKKKIIDDVSFAILRNTSLAIVGGSGSGKTTLCNLISRFWDVDSGKVLIGGNAVSDYKPEELLKNYSMVFQHVYLFNDTIAHNIRFGKPDATEDEIIAAAQKACCHDFIMQLPQGYDTVLGEGGASISGGEKQRISIARAIIKDSPIVILDEATANVDPENEYQLQQAIKELTKSKTVIMIAHRLKTVKNADNIIVLKDGSIAEQGTHAKLITQNGEYAKFVGMRKKAIGWKLGTHKQS
ncbi:MAG: ABC transporter ATP-binding protein [Spirochaetales bacterium]